MLTEDGERESQLWITDKRGGRLRVSWSADQWHWRFRVFDRAKFVAQANCLVQSPQLKLGDLEVFEGAGSPVQNWVHWVFRKVFGERNHGYRNRGIGSALIALIVQLAKERQMTVLYGDLGPHDLMANPDLPNWYRRLGFSILEGGDFGLGRVELIIRKAPNEAVS